MGTITESKTRTKTNETNDLIQRVNLFFGRVEKENVDDNKGKIGIIDSSLKECDDDDSSDVSRSNVENEEINKPTVELEFALGNFDNSALGLLEEESEDSADEDEHEKELDGLNGLCL